MRQEREEIGGGVEILQGAEQELFERGSAAGPDLEPEGVVGGSKAEEMVDSFWEIA